MKALSLRENLSYHPEKCRDRSAGGERFSEQNERLVVRSPAGRFGDDKIVLILERVAEHGFLQVSVQRIVPTMFGPAARKLDTFLFQLAP